MIDIFFNLWENLFSCFINNSIGRLALSFIMLGIGFALFRIFEKGVQ